MGGRGGVGTGEGGSRVEGWGGIRRLGGGGCEGRCCVCYFFF